MAINLLAAKLLGNDLDEKKVHLSAPPKEMAEGEYSIGTVFYNDRPFRRFGIREQEWIQNAAILGRSGAG